MRIVENVNISIFYNIDIALFNNFVDHTQNYLRKELSIKFRFTNT